MGDVGSYIWFIGLGLGIVILGIAMAVAKSRGRNRAVGDPNHAWEQAAAETGHPEVAHPDRPSSAPRTTGV